MNGFPKPSHELQAAFELFNQASEHLTHSYQLLEQEVQRLHHDLNHSKIRRHHQEVETTEIVKFQQTILNALGAAVIVIDRTGQVIAHNVTAKEVFPEIHNGVCWAKFISENIQDGQPHARYVRNKTDQWLEVDTRPLGESPGQVIMIRDVTVQNESETRVRRMQRLAEMGEMLAKIAHQIRTPLSTALLYASQLKPLLEQTHVHSHAQSIYVCLHHMRQLISDMLMFSKGEQFEVGPAEFASVIRELETTFPAPIWQRVKLIARESVGSEKILVNIKALTAALGNLIMNAVEASDQDQSIVMESYAQDGFIWIEVRDQGHGMSPEILERVFDPFYTTKPNGTGLGMAVVRAVVEAHAGTIRINSRVHQGTVITIQLPRMQAITQVQFLETAEAFADE